MEFLFILGAIAVFLFLVAQAPKGSPPIIRYSSGYPTKEEWNGYNWEQAPEYWNWI